MRQHGGDLRHGGEQIGARDSRRVEMDGQRADPALGTDFPDGRPLAQQDFEQIKALPVALERRNDDPDATLQDVRDLNVERNVHAAAFSSTGAGSAFTGAGAAPLR